MSRLTLEQASTIVDAALGKGAELGFKPLTVVVLDDGGNMKAMKRQDGAGPFRPQGAEDLTLGNAEIDIVHRREVAVLLGQSLDLDGNLAISGHPNVPPAARGSRPERSCPG